MCKQNEETKFVPGSLNQTPWLFEMQKPCAFHLTYCAGARAK